MGGGIEAPGIFWLAVLPFFYGMFYGRRGAIVGMCITFSTYGFYLTLREYGFSGTIVMSEEEMYVERISNIFNYSLIMALYYISYTTAFERSNQKLAESKELIDNLFRVVLHDITNPISAVKLRTRLLKKKISEEQIEEVLKVETSINKVIGILDSLRNFKAIEDGVIEIPLERTSVRDMLEEFCGDALEKSLERDIKFKQNLELNPTSFIMCHSESFKNQVLTNILTNALKFSEKGGKIEVNAFEDKDKVFVEIVDFGIGIPDSILENLFRFDKPTSRVGIDGEQGTGYGLPITKYFTEFMGGKLDVASKEKSDVSKDHGTKFSICFNKITESPV
jgi:signal transduction histidine kinase